VRILNLIRQILAVVVACCAARAEFSDAQSVNVWLTTDDQTHTLEPQAPVSFSTGTGGTNPIVVDETQTYQQIEGFGAAFTDTTGYNLNESATKAARNSAMTNLFTRNADGIGLSFVRNPMAACDLSLSVYSYDDLPAGQTDTNLAFFSIAHDQKDIIPLLQLTLQLNPQLKTMANPWSPPGWMKSSGSMIGGTLLSNMYAPFALYFVKYIQAYQAAGIPVNYISLQNEPLYQPSNYPGMGMDPGTQTTVLRDYILPALAANNLTNTKVLVYDHNWDQPSYPQTVLSDSTVDASSQVAGTAWHGYGGTPGAMLTLQAGYSSKGSWETEHSGFEGNDQVRSDFEEIIHVMRCWGKAYVKWNLAGDENDGPHTGGCGNCRPLVYVNSTTHAVSYSIEFYTLGHFSKFVLPGAYRIYSSDAAGVVTAAFLNPDYSKVLVAFNDTGSSTTFQVQWGSQSFSYTLGSYCGASFTWAGTQSGSYTLNPTNLVQASSLNSVSSLETEPTTDVLGGYDVGYASGGSYATYRNVNFATGFTNVTGRLASAGAGGTLEFHLDSPSGPKAGSLAVPITGGWQTWQNVTGQVTGGTGLHTLYAVFTGSSGIGNVNWFQFTGAVSPLPSPWTAADIGSVGLAGNATAAGGIFTLNGSGNDIWNTADAFQFANQPVSGNCEIRAHISSLQNTDPWAKAGLMIRDSLAPGAINAAVLLTPSNGVTFQIRSITGGATTSTSNGGGSLTAPRWLRLVRGSGNLFAGYYSSDGSNWTQVGASTIVPMFSAPLIGLAVSAHNNASNCVATFDSVTVNQAPVLAPIPNQTILAGRTLTITNSATDADIPTQALSYTLSNAPTGANINSNSGLFTWRPTIAQSPSTQTVAVVVSDNGVPNMSAAQSFTMIVNRPANPVLSSASASDGQFSMWLSGDTGPDYVIESSSNLLSWSGVSTSTPPSLPFWWTTTNTQSPLQFYRVRLGP
jgi:glucosylceramidase